MVWGEDKEFQEIVLSCGTVKNVLVETHVLCLSWKCWSVALYLFRGRNDSVGQI